MKPTPQINNCRSCESLNLDPVWKLSNSPYGDFYKNTEDEAFKVKSETLSLGFCNDCKMLQLLEVTDLTSTYNDYLYRESITNALSSYYAQVVTRLISDYSLKPKGLIVDIGSNDGTFLSNFLSREFKVLGVEPSRENAKTSELKGIYTINEYFEEHTKNRILAEFGYPSLISINYTLANIPDLLTFLVNVERLMDRNTVLSVITGYHPDQYSVNMFEYINHDHLTYLTVESFGNVCKVLNLKIIDVNRSEHKGGSLQFIISKDTAKFEIQSSVGQLLQREIWLNANSTQFTKNLKLRVDEVSVEVIKMLNSINCNKIYGIGASMSTTYLCNQFNLNSRIVKLFDDDANKIGRFAPGSGIEVKALMDIPNKEESIALILAWQHSEKLIKRLQSTDYPGRIITPLPFPKLLH